MIGTKLHPVYCFGYVKYLLLLLIGPIWAAFSARDVGAMFTYLREDALLFLAVGFFVVALWFATNYAFDGKTITVEEGLFFQRTHVIPLTNITCLSIERPFFYRLMRASKLSIYFETPSGSQKFSFPLPEKRAARIAAAVFPLEGVQPFYQPTGRGRFSFAFLSTDLVASVFVIFSLYSQLSDFLGERLASSAQQGVSTISNILGVFLPAGLAVAVAAGLLLGGMVLTSSLLRTGGFSTSCSDRLIVVEGGFFTHREFRFLREKITSSTVRVSVASRLARRYPLYISAGGYSGKDLPVFIYRKGDEARVRQLLPGFRAPFTKYCSPAKKSIGHYLGLPASLLALSCTALALFATRVPELFSASLILVFFSALLFVFAVEGIFREGVTKKDGTISISHCRNFTRNITQIYGHNYLLKTSCTSLGALKGVCTLRLSTGDRRKIRARSVQQQTVTRLFGEQSLPLAQDTIVR